MNLQELGISFKGFTSIEVNRSLFVVNGYLLSRATTVISYWF